MNHTPIPPSSLDQPLYKTSNDNEPPSRRESVWASTITRESVSIRLQRHRERVEGQQRLETDDSEVELGKGGDDGL